MIMCGQFNLHRSSVATAELDVLLAELGAEAALV